MGKITALVLLILVLGTGLGVGIWQIMVHMGVRHFRVGKRMRPLGMGMWVYFCFFVGQGGRIFCSTRARRRPPSHTHTHKPA